MKKQTNTDLRRKLREQRAAYEELLGLSGAILAALCVRCGDGATLRLPKQAVHDALETYEFAAGKLPKVVIMLTILSRSILIRRIVMVLFAEHTISSLLKQIR